MFQTAVKTIDNWTGCQADTSNSTNDPLVEQINIIKGYIKQARDALRFEEVNAMPSAEIQKKMNSNVVYF